MQPRFYVGHSLAPSGHASCGKIALTEEGSVKVSLCILCLAFAATAAAQPALLVTTPKVIRDADGLPVLIYGDNDPSGPLVVTQETFVASPVVVAKQPAVRDVSGNAVRDGSGAPV